MRASTALAALLPVALALNHTRAPVTLDTYFIGVWDVFVSDDGPAQVQHKLEVNATALGSMWGTLSVVTQQSFLPVARWDILVSGSNGETGVLSATPTGSSSTGFHAFVCPFKLRNIAPGVLSSLVFEDGIGCSLVLRASDNVSQAQLTLVVQRPEGDGTTYAVAGARRRAASEASFWSRYGYYGIMALIVAVQVGLRLYARRGVPKDPAAAAAVSERRAALRAAARARINESATAAAAAVAAGAGSSGAAAAALSAVESAEQATAAAETGGGPGADVPATDAAAKKGL